VGGNVRKLITSHWDMLSCEVRSLYFQIVLGHPESPSGQLGQCVGTLVHGEVLECCAALVCIHCETPGCGELFSISATEVMELSRK